MKWSEKLFTGGEDLDESRPRYVTGNYYIVCGYIAIHSLLIFLALLTKNIFSLLFLVMFTLTAVQLGGMVWK